MNQVTSDQEVESEAGVCKNVESAYRSFRLHRNLRFKASLSKPVTLVTLPHEYFLRMVCVNVNVPVASAA